MYTLDLKIEMFQKFENFIYFYLSKRNYNILYRRIRLEKINSNVLIKTYLENKRKRC